MIVIINYGLGNLGSIANMLRKIGVGAQVSSEVSAIEKADKLILPGVGAFDRGITNLKEENLLPILNKKVLEDKTPILGICLGMQLMGKGSEEGSQPGLGWLDAEIVRFQLNRENSSLRIPHMGWNMLNIVRSHPIFMGLEQENRFYFVHSFHMICTKEENILAKSQYGYSFAAVAGYANIIGVQFHPEKSHRFGMRLLKNFAEWDYS
jgi:glutamine amidotransferase